MAHDQWRGVRPIAALQMQIAMTHTCASNLDLHFARAGRRNINVENLNRLIRGREDNGAHGNP
jgi:hypothetical protein